MSVDHYENFPVASWLCPARLRPAVRAIYWFARNADDIADEGSATASERLADLAAYRAELGRAVAGSKAAANDDRWPGVFAPLADAIVAYRLPVPLLEDLLSAFEQDVGNPAYPDRSALLDYCRRSANPIGRLLLHLYGVTDAASLARSDAVCSALQLINFWQDPSVDLPRGRSYFPAFDLARFGVRLDAAPIDTPASKALLRDLCGWAETLMRSGAPLTHTLGGRAGWELRLVVQGGLRILEKVARMDHATLTRRPRLGFVDGFVVAWRALSMRAGSTADRKHPA